MLCIYVRQIPCLLSFVLIYYELEYKHIVKFDIVDVDVLQVLKKCVGVGVDVGVDVGVSFFGVLYFLRLEIFFSIMSLVQAFHVYSSLKDQKKIFVHEHRALLFSTHSLAVDERRRAEDALFAI